eukprot:2513382-Alexandrium_andersonii.AAC.1
MPATAPRAQAGRGGGGGRPQSVGVERTRGQPQESGLVSVSGCSELTGRRGWRSGGRARPQPA